MKSRTLSEENRLLCEQALLELVNALTSQGTGGIPESDRLYFTALECLVDTLLTRFGEEPSAELCSRNYTGCAEGIRIQTPEDVGEIYEYLRRFTLQTSSGAELSLVLSALSRRNQGLFYTPRPVVQHIVRSSLDALAISNPAKYLDVRILDPAVGTGTFLLEALQEISDRVLSPSAAGSSHVSERIDQVRNELRASYGKQGMEIEPDPRTSVRVHIMNRCLYGVDLDPIATRIARSALKRKAFGEFHAIPGKEARIRIGNALMGASGEAGTETLESADRTHARAYLGKTLRDEREIFAWRSRKQPVHWPLEYPEVFEQRGGFDCVIGNPPYEIMSVKESGMAERRREQAYYRTMYATCRGKINTYRLMTERGLTLLRNRGVLGFIMPATFLADTTASKLREKVFDESQVIQALVIPEKARLFDGVTQALLILVTRKGAPTHAITPTIWNGTAPIPVRGTVKIDRDLIERTGFRIPLFRSRMEKDLLKSLMRHPPLKGDSNLPPVGFVHQGEVNLTVHREFITDSKTQYPLIRGEHVQPLHVSHPSGRTGRLDWVLPRFLHERPTHEKASENGVSLDAVPLVRARRGVPWGAGRIVLGRVVNMGTDRRLKAAPVSPWMFLGDMTNFICNISLSQDYLLGLLNSRLLNWRIKLTSTNNYLSAAEIESLPVPRVSCSHVSAEILRTLEESILASLSDLRPSISQWVPLIAELTRNRRRATSEALLAWVLEWLVRTIRQDPRIRPLKESPWWNALDAVVLLLYGCESFAEIIEPMA